MGSGTIFYVHGAGNRKAAAESYEAQLREGLERSSAWIAKLQRSDWGQQLGPDPLMPGLESILPEVIRTTRDSPPSLTSPIRWRRSVPGRGWRGRVRGPQVRRGPAARTAPGGHRRPRRGARRARGHPDGGGGADRRVAGVPGRHGGPRPSWSTRPSRASRRPRSPRRVVRRSSASVTCCTRSAASRAASPGRSWAPARPRWWAAGAGTALLPGLKLGLSKQLAKDRAAIMRKTALVPTDVLFYQRHGAKILPS